MKTAAVLVGAFLLWVSTASAQTPVPDVANALSIAPAALPGQANNGFGVAASPEVLIAELTPSTPLLAPKALPWASLPVPAPPEPAPQGVQGVFPNHNWQAYVGYTYLRFYEAPNHTINENGFNVSAAYYFKDWIAADGELVAVFGSSGGANTSFVLGAAGPRLRWSTGHGPEVWLHALVGGAYSSPKTPYGGQDAFGFELGGGIDINSRHRRIAYRLQADIVGTRFFSTYQYSPKISAGIVYKF